MVGKKLASNNGQTCTFCFLKEQQIQKLNSDVEKLKNDNKKPKPILTPEQLQERQKKTEEKKKKRESKENEYKKALDENKKLKSTLLVKFGVDLNDDTKQQ